MTSIRAKARQNLMVAVNAAIEQGHLTLACEPLTETIFEFTLDDLPVIARISDVGFAGFVEVRLQVVCLPTDYGRKAIATLFVFQQHLYGAAVTVGLLERGTGKYLHEFGGRYYGTHHINERLAEFTVKPFGFTVRPPAHRRARP